MNAALLDTVVLLRALFLPDKLTAAARTMLEDGSCELHYSPASLWEIGIKMSLNGFHGLRLPDDWERCIPAALTDFGTRRVELEPEDCRRVQDLPFHHRDPFDRMLVAQGMNRGFVIISPDTAFDAYGMRRVW